jgi:hypothetical protein
MAVKAASVRLLFGVKDRTVSNQPLAGEGRSTDRTTQPARFQWIASDMENVVAQIFSSWNPLTSWMRQIEGFKRAA